MAPQGTFSRLRFSSQDPTMGSQGATKGAKTENVLQIDKPEQPFIDLHAILPGIPFSQLGPRMGSQGTTKETKRNMHGKQKEPLIIVE